MSAVAQNETAPAVVRPEPGTEGTRHRGISEPPRRDWAGESTLLSGTTWGVSPLTLDTALPVAGHRTHAWLVPHTYSLGLLERQVLVAAIDVALLALVASILATLHNGPGDFVAIAGPVIPTWLLVGYFANLFHPMYTSSRSATARAMARTIPFVIGVLLVVFFLWPYAMSRSDLIAMGVGAPLLVGIWRLVYVRLTDSAYFERRLLVVGAGASATALLNTLGEYGGHGLRVIGLVDDDPIKQGSQVAGAPVLGSSDDLRQLVASNRIGEVVVAVSHGIGDRLRRGLASCYAAGVPISLMEHVYERVTEQVPIEHASDRWVGAVPLQPAGSLTYGVAKRAGDILIAGLGLLLTLPLLLVVAVAVRLSSSGPILFRQERFGLHGRSITVLKFRTMVKKSNSLEVSRVGRWLRRSHLDELPQLFNILRGDMSLVGPRPKRADQAAMLEQQIPLYCLRYAVRPGLTGLAQIRFRYAHDPYDEMSKLRYDLYYVKHRSALMDLSILARTFAHVLGLRGY